ncbi:MAG: hypothetical protein ACM3TR_17490 [Caulobacteraceae bacterium]
MFKNAFTRLAKNRRMLKWAAIVAAAVIEVAVIKYNNAAQVRIETVKLGSMQEVVELQGKVELENKEKVFSRLSYMQLPEESYLQRT